MAPKKKGRKIAEDESWVGSTHERLDQRGQPRPSQQEPDIQSPEDLLREVRKENQMISGFEPNRHTVIVEGRPIQVCRKR